MTRTPDEIKKGLECCTMPLCAECPYDNEPSCVVKNVDALALIQQLQAENTEQAEKIKQLETERDAAVETIYEMAKCITEDVCEWCDGVECERLCMQHTILRPGFKWRGAQKEE